MSYMVGWMNQLNELDYKYKLTEPEVEELCNRLSRTGNSCISVFEEA